MKPKYLNAADCFDGWRDDLLTGKAPTLWPVGSGDLSRIEVGPGRVILLGGAPGAGKSAFAMQCVIDALRTTPTLRGLVCSVEMSPTVLLDRQLARLSGIDLDTVQRRRFADEHADALDQGLRTLEGIADRLNFCRLPYDLANVAASADAVHADMLLLDYIQRIPPPGRHNDARSAVNATMNFIRAFAEAGCGVFVVAAVARTKDKRGKTSYDADGLSLASFRESSELEFGCDDAFILAPDPDAAQYDSTPLVMKHLKARHGRTKDLQLRFDRALQRFTVEDPTIWDPNRTPLADTLRDAWDATPPADDDGGDPWN